MKRFFAIVVLFALFALPALSESIDVSALSDADLRQLIDDASSELIHRVNSADDGVTFEAGVPLLSVEGYTVTLTGNYDFDAYDADYAQMALWVVVENNSTRSLGLRVDNAAANDWVVYCSGVPSIQPGQKIKDSLSLQMSDAGLFDFSELRTLALSLRVYDAETYEDVGDIATTKLLFDR